MRKKLLIGFLAGTAMACLASCGGENVIDETPSGDGGGSMGDRMGPAGCYMKMLMMCDCDVAEADCPDNDTSVWTDGCASCEE